MRNKCLFLLNEHGDLYFLLHNNSVHIISLNLKENQKILSKGKKDIGKRVHKTVTLWCKLWPTKIITLRTLYLHVVLNSVMFPQILYHIVLYICSTLSTRQVFSRVLLLWTMFRATAKCNVDRWIMRVISTSTGLKRVRLTHYIS